MDNATEFYHIRNALLEAALADYQDAGPETGSAVGPVRGHPAGGVGGDGVDGGAGGPCPPRHLEF